MSDPTAEVVLSRRGTFSVALRSRAALYAAWIPLLRNGGLFIPCDQEHSLGEEILLLVTVLEEPSIVLRGHVAWVSPPQSTGSRPQGIGVHLAEGDPTRDFKTRVEGLLATALNSSRPTHTM